MTDIQNRFNRILSIYLQLQSKPLVTAKEFALRYNVSLRTIYRDIQALIQVGVPIYGEAGAGYSLVDGYKMPPIRFTEREVLSLVAAEKLVEKYTDQQIVHNFSTSLHKVKAILRSEEKEKVSLGQDRILIRTGKSSFNDNLTNGIHLLIESVISKKCVEIEYLKPTSHEVENRIIEPVGIFVESKYWYTMAYCHLRQDYRQFRLDRMKEIKVSDHSFSKEHKDLEFYLTQNKNTKTTRIIIEVDVSIAWHLEWEKDYFGFSHQIQKLNTVEMYFDCAASEEGFGRWFMMFADKAKIIEPLSLEMIVIQFLKDSLKNRN